MGLQIFRSAFLVGSSPGRPSNMLFYRRNTNTKVIKEAAKIWKIGQIFGMTCLTLEDEPKVNRFLLIPVITSVAVARTIAFLLDYLMVFTAIVVLSMSLNSRKVLKALWKVFQTPVEIYNHHGKTKESKLMILLYIFAGINLCLRCMELVAVINFKEKVPLHLKLQHVAIMMVIIKIRLLKLFILRINYCIPKKFDEAVRRLRDIIKCAITDRLRTGKRNRHRRPDSPDPNPKSKRDDISINQLT
ncbi:hypothetical protein EVAR_31259_1 [Eumeta japonica]|uniref:Uncharacterized protein n=1 Tax=Eumeta variegata TaxID=151549 RepID=A0A4C1W2E9_EUMVA|nr:hypothetical protein EVAR_31259_1 [Eumeta japonica]